MGELLSFQIFINEPVELLNLSLNAKAVLPEAAVLMAMIGTLLVDLAGEKISARWSPPICYAGLGSALLLLTMQWNGEIQESFLGAFIADNLAIAFRGVIVLSTLISLLISWRYADQNGSPIGEFAAILLAATLGAMLLCGSTDLVSVFVSLETLSVASYLLSGYLKRDSRSSEAALKYLLVGSAAAAVFLYGASLLYGISGSTNLKEIGTTLLSAPSPLSALALVILAERAGFPPGLINIVTGNTNEIGAEMTSNSLVRKLTFTGSTPVGKKLITDCAQTVKRTSMELGGNAPFIIFDDADIAEAIKGVMISKYRNAGQTCVCTNRILVQNSVYDEFLSKFKAECENLVVGNGLGEETTIGPLINRKAAADVKDLIEDAKSKGAISELGENNNAYGDCYVEPTILSNINTSMRVFNEEIFGPVAPIIKFESEDEAVELANKTEFGLAAYFYSRDIGRIYRVSEALEFGIVGVNEGIISNEMAPFGGIKESGNGREGSKYGLDDYLEIKYLCIGGIDQ